MGKNISGKKSKHKRVIAIQSYGMNEYIQASLDICTAIKLTVMNLKGHTGDLLGNDHHRPGTTAGYSKEAGRKKLIR